VLLVCQKQAALKVADRVASIKVDRRALAARIETLESEIDRHHAALHEADPVIGSSYRTLLGELMATESKGSSIDVPALRSRFHNQ
jgi:primosomal replication protein N''